ncbi:SDR family oxidoreductase [Amphibiibacter pelophylacis]|uniref:SDR family oxidoreductase n=1 Tax=Amphibiibacter pelophylacis TaxID=1799477 RepID=A0ACC6NZ81_9BURK
MNPSASSRTGTGPLVFITGASSGIGQALARRFVATGHRVALVARRLDEMQAWAAHQGWSEQIARCYGADVTDTDAMLDAARRCEAEQGLPDIVIANAGISLGVDTAHREDVDVFDRVMRTNMHGTVATFHPFIAAMCQRGSGQLVGIASVAAVRGLPGHGAYCASKAAVVAYCESLRGECRPHGVRVSTLLPGYVATPLTASNRYSMPFLMTADDFAARAVDAIRAGRRYCVIPWPMAIVARVLRWLPPVLLDRLLQGRERKHRANDTSGTASGG